jgi:hypothetical protein
VFFIDEQLYDDMGDLPDEDEDDDQEPAPVEDVGDVCTVLTSIKMKSIVG